LGIAGFLGAILIWSAFAKSLDGSEVQRTLRYALSIVRGQSSIDPGAIALSAWAARLLILVEVVMGMGLILGGTRRRFLCASALFAGFSAFVLFLLLSDAPVSCGCGIGGRARVDGWALTRSGTFLTLAIIGWWLAGRDGSALRARGHTRTQKGNEP